MNIDAIVDGLDGYAPQRIDPGSQVRAAVLVALQAGQHGAEVVLTRRSRSLGSHAGQVAFPGGRIDPDDVSVEAAALREAHEELGIPFDSVRMIGELDHVMSSTGYHVTPLVGVLRPSTPLVANPAEVERVFCVPLARLAVLSAWERRSHRYHGLSVQLWHFAWDGEDIWGMTAHTLRGLLERVAEFCTVQAP